MNSDPRMPLPTDQALLATIQAGTREAARDALRQLYERHADAVFTFLGRLERDVNLCEDILQESFLVAREQAGRFREGSARPWLLAIAAGRLRSARRARRRRTAREERAAGADTSGTWDEAADHELETKLAELPATERAVLDLRFHAGLGFAEIAQVLGVSLRTAKSWSASGLARLRRAMDVEEGP